MNLEPAIGPLTPSLSPSEGESRQHQQISAPSTPSPHPSPPQRGRAASTSRLALPALPHPIPLPLRGGEGARRASGGGSEVQRANSFGEFSPRGEGEPLS